MGSSLPPPDRLSTAQASDDGLSHRIVEQVARCGAVVAVVRLDERVEHPRRGDTYHRHD